MSSVLAICTQNMFIHINLNKLSLAWSNDHIRQDPIVRRSTIADVLYRRPSYEAFRSSDPFPLEYQIVSMYITVIPFAQHNFTGLQASSLFRFDPVDRLPLWQVSSCVLLIRSLRLLSPSAAFRIRLNIEYIESVHHPTVIEYPKEVYVLNIDIKLPVRRLVTKS